MGVPVIKRWYGLHRVVVLLGISVFLAGYSGMAQPVPAAVIGDPAPDLKHPAQLVELTVPSHGARVNAVFYLSAGAGVHPTVLLLHGFPGNEQNLDLAQSMRRAGWHVLTLHYRGSWGSPGDFSFTHALEDTEAALEFVRDPANAAKYGIDTKTIVLIGHSMGGFMALHAAADHADISGVVVLSAANFGKMATGAKTPEGEKKVIEFYRQELAPLAGCTAESLWAETKANAGKWDFVDYAPALKATPVLILEADDGLGGANAAMAAALRKVGNEKVKELHMATDHSFSDHRIALQAAVVSWLGGVGK